MTLGEPRIEPPRRQARQEIKNDDQDPGLGVIASSTALAFRHFYSFSWRSWRLGGSSIAIDSLAVRA
jgi:hypothetical protein